jgi:tetratricopeptide (TPR) repeat protein
MVGARTHTNPRWLALVMALACACWTDGARAEGEDAARAHFLLGRSHFDAGEFTKAAAEFEEAYRISQRPALLYNLYVAYRDAGDTANAARTLREYLAKEQNIENRPQLEARLVALERTPATPTTAATPAEAAPTEATPTEPVAPSETQLAANTRAAEDTEPPAPKRSIVLPLVLIGTGGAMVIGSVVTGLMASSAQSELEEMCPTRMNCPAGLEDTQSKGQTMALLTDILLFGGVAVAGAGAALWVFGGSSEDEPQASAACAPGGCAASVRLRF